jgi:hypothetical protein
LDGCCVGEPTECDSYEGCELRFDALATGTTMARVLKEALRFSSGILALRVEVGGAAAIAPAAPPHLIWPST